VERGFQPWKYSLYTNPMALSDAISPTGSRNCPSAGNRNCLSTSSRSADVEKHADISWFRAGALAPFPPPPEVHETQCGTAHAFGGFTSGFTSGFAGGGTFEFPVASSTYPHFAAVTHHLAGGDPLYPPTGTGNSFVGGTGSTSIGGGIYGGDAATSFGVCPPPAFSLSHFNADATRNTLGGWALDRPGPKTDEAGRYASPSAAVPLPPAASQPSWNGARYFPPHSSSLLAAGESKTEDSFRYPVVGGGSSPRKAVEKRSERSGRQTGGARRRAAAGSGAGRGSSACDCPNCREADRVGGAMGDQLRRLGQHACHVPGCGKVYAKTSHLKAHLHWHSGERPFVCSWLLCGKRSEQ